MAAQNWALNKFQLALILGAIGIIALAIGPAFWLRSFCSTIGDEKARIAYHVTESREIVPDRTRPLERGPPQTSSGKIARTDLIITTQSKTADYPLPAPPYWRRFFCEINGADYTLALFTILLAISTIFLWLVTERTLRHAKADALRQTKESRTSLRISVRAANATRKSADAADLSAKAAISVELPILRVMKVHTVRDGQFANNPQDWIDRCYPMIEIKNFGRTTAFINDFKNGAYFGVPLPNDPTYTPIERYVPLIAIEAGQTYTFTDFRLVGSFTAEQKAEFLAGNPPRLALFGEINFTDFLGNSHVQGWLYIWVHANKEFSPLIRGKINYNKQN